MPSSLRQTKGFIVASFRFCEAVRTRHSDFGVVMSKAGRVPGPGKNFFQGFFVNLAEVERTNIESGLGKELAAAPHSFRFINVEPFLG